MGIGQAGATTSETGPENAAGPRRRFAQVLGWTLVWTGVYLLAYVGWLVFGTDLVNARIQEAAAVDLEQRFEVAPPPDIEPVVVEEKAVERVLEQEPPAGTGFAMMRVPKVGLDAVMFEGTSTETLALGPGHMSGTSLPGQPGNAVISGHRTTHGRPFHDFDLLEPGDLIEIETGIGTHVYEVRDSFIVAPTDVWVTEPRSGAWLTMTTCNPKYSARERLIVTAELVSGPNAEYVSTLEEPTA
jgi:sortase A